MRPDLHSQLGELLAFIGLPGAAVVAFRDALAAWPGSPVRELRLGRALLAAGRWPEAAACFKACARKQSWNVEARGHLVWALARAGRPAATLAALRDFIAATPAAAEPWILLGVLERRAGRQHEAIRAFRQAARLQMDARARRFVLGETLLGEREWEQALSAHGRVACAGAAGPARAPAANALARAGRDLQRRGVVSRARLGAFARRVLGQAQLRLGKLAARHRPHVGLRYLRSGQRLMQASVQ